AVVSSTSDRRPARTGRSGARRTNHTQTDRYRPTPSPPRPDLGALAQVGVEGHLEPPRVGLRVGLARRGEHEPSVGRVPHLEELEAQVADRLPDDEPHVLSSKLVVCYDEEVTCLSSALPSVPDRP